MDDLTDGGPTRPRRPAPQLTVSSEAFWASGADGLLRIAQCQSCWRFHHPPLLACPDCHGAAVAMTPVSGRGVVAGFTVNEHEWLPGFPPPYVVAVVALDEDPAVRLTTNITGCEPGDVAIGMRVRVVFEQQASTWFPLFEPVPGAGPGPVPPPRDVAEAVRPMVSPDKFEDRVALTGVGSSRIGRRLMLDPLALAVQACLAAVEDAGLTLDDIDGLCSSPGGTVPGFSEGGVTDVAEALRIRPTWISGGAEFPGPAGCAVAAMLAVASGLCRHVLCLRTVWEASHAHLVRAGWTRSRGGDGGASGMLEWRAPFGAMSAANWIGVNASHYFWRYGGDRASTLAPIALTARANAARNPQAIYTEPLTLADYLGARMISSPFGLYDCDVPCDGAIAVVVSSIDTVADLRKPPVLVEAVGTQIADRISWDQGTLSHEPQVLGPAAHLWTRTSLRPEDVNIAELDDGFTFNAVSWLEALGFCGLGEAADFLDGGKTIALDGRLPLNTHGGQLSAGRTHGFGFLQEAMLQLRGEAGDRQVAGARVAVVTTGGGTPGGAILLRSAG